MLGFCEYNDVIRDDEEDEENDETNLIDNWNYIIFNGFFSEKPLMKYLKQEKTSLKNQLENLLRLLIKQLTKN